MADDSDDSKWHLDKKVPIAIIGVILVQTFGMGFYAATQSAHTESNTQRIDALEKTMLPRLESVIRLETKMDSLQSSVTEIKSALTAVVATGKDGQRR